MICLVSEMPYVYSSCAHCDQENKDTIVEFVRFAPATRDDVKNGRKIYGKFTLEYLHEHLASDWDLKSLSEMIDEKCEPFCAGGQDDLEAWLWRFYLQSQPLKGRAWQLFRKEQKKQRLGKKYQAVEQMFWAAANVPSVYHDYYDFYISFLLGRNYLLFR
jgi:hypothetical protein